MKKIYYTFVDLFRFFEMTTEMYIYKNPPKGYVKNPIVLIPGLGCRWAGIKHLADFIESKGFPIYVVKELGDNLFEIPYSAKIVKKIIEENDLRNAILVGHSKGGLIGKYLMIHDDRDKRVLGMVAIATPFSGSKLANFLVIHRWKQFGTSDPLILELQSDKSVNNRIISISPSYDTAIWHKNKSNLEGAMENITVSVSGHLNMVYKQELKDTVEKSIDKIAGLS